MESETQQGAQVLQDALRPNATPAPESPLEPPLEVRPEMHWHDFSSISNPLGTPQALLNVIVSAVQRHTIQFPPDRDAHALREVLAAALNLRPENFLCGTGVTEMIRTIAQTYQPCRVGLTLPCRPEYALAVAYAGHQIVEITAKSGYYTPDPASLHQRGIDFDAALLENPGFPSSRLLPRQTLLHYLDICKWVIVDERSIELSFSGESVVDLTTQYRNLIVVRSLVETYALEGTPVSYCVAHADTIKQISLFFDSSSISMFAEILAGQLMSLSPYLDQTHDILDGEIPWMQWMLNLIPGIKIYPAEANYIMCELVNDGTLDMAVSTTEELSLKMQLQDFGLHALNGVPGLENNRFFYVAVKTHPENEAFVRALRTCLMNKEDADAFD